MTAAFITTSRVLQKWRLTMADDRLPQADRLHAADMATIFGSETDIRDAAEIRASILAEIRTPEAPFAWVDEPPARINGPALLVIAVAVGIVMGIAVAAWGQAMSTQINHIRLNAEQPE